MITLEQNSTSRGTTDGALCKEDPAIYGSIFMLWAVIRCLPGSILLDYVRDVITYSNADAAGNLRVVPI